MSKAYELTREEYLAVSRIAGDNSWSFTYDEVLKMSQAAQRCDALMSLDSPVSLAVGILPTEWKIPESIDTFEKVKAFIVELLEDVNYHGEACLVENSQYRLLDEHYNMLKEREEKEEA